MSAVRHPEPRVVVFDVNETLSDLGPLQQRFADVGAPQHLAPTWFASVLRDGMALSTVGETAAFADIGAALLDSLLPGFLSGEQREEAVTHVMQGFTSLGVHPDVVDGMRALRARGLRLVTLSNGAASVAEGLLERAGAADLVERTLSVADAGVWKPAAASYAYAAEQTGEPAPHHLLVAVHPWDLHGAQRAGFSSAWIDRTEQAPYPGHFLAPQVRASGLVDLAERLDAWAGADSTR